MTSNKKTILILIDWYEPGYKAGGPIRSVVNLVSHLKPHLQFKIITRNTDYTEKIPYKGIPANRWVQTDESVSVYYISSDQLGVSMIKKLIASTPHDVMYLNSLFSPYFALVPLIFKKEKTILAVRGMLSDGALGVKSFKKKFFLKMAKLLGFYNTVHFQATNSDEKTQILKTFPKNEVSIVPNLSQGSVYSDFTPTFEKKKNELNLFFLGRVAPEKNTLYAIELASKLKNIKVNLDIYGAVYDQQYFGLCNELISSCPPNVKVEYKGIIEPKDLSKILLPYHALLFPSTGENFGHAIIESLLHKKPVVISDKTPWKSNRCIFTHPLEDQNAYIQTLTTIAEMSNDEYQQLASNALEYGNSVTTSEDKINSYLHIFGAP